MMSRTGAPVLSLKQTTYLAAARKWPEHEQNAHRESLTKTSRMITKKEIVERQPSVGKLATKFAATNLL
jgi:hypothetical protein